MKTAISPSLFLHKFPRTARNPPPSPKSECWPPVFQHRTGSNLVPCCSTFTANTLSQLPSPTRCNRECQEERSSWTRKDDSRDKVKTTLKQKEHHDAVQPILRVSGAQVLWHKFLGTTVIKQSQAAGGFSYYFLIKGGYVCTDLLLGIWSLCSLPHSGQLL